MFQSPPTCIYLATYNLDSREQVHVELYKLRHVCLTMKK